MNKPKLSIKEWTDLILAVCKALGKAAMPHGSTLEQLAAGKMVAEGVLVTAIGSSRARALVDRQEGPTLSKNDTRRIVKELAAVAPGATIAEKATWARDVGSQAFANPTRFAEVLAYVEERVAAHEAAGGTLDVTPTPPEPESTLKEEATLKGGDGTYKPESNLWLLPAVNPTNGKRFTVDQLGIAGEFQDEVGLAPVLIAREVDGKAMLVPKRFKLANSGAFRNRDTDGSFRVTDPGTSGYYHNGRLKLRDAKAVNSGSRFLTFDVYGQQIFSKLIIDRNRRQE